MLPSLPILLSASNDGELDIKGEGENQGPKHKEPQDDLFVEGISSVGPDKKDNEAELAALMKASTTIKTPRSVSKKKPPQIRHLEKTLNCLLADNEEIKDEKSFAFAQAYFLKVTERLHGKDDATYDAFMKMLSDFGQSINDVPELYSKITKILSNYPDLSEEFLSFLLPEQAMACGKFMEYLMLTKMKGFCRKLEIYYSKQPTQLRKIFSSLATLSTQKNTTVKDLRDTLFPLLRNNSFLINMLLEMIPTNAPHESSLTHFESMDFQGTDQLKDLFETVAIPRPAEDSYGGPQCICSCHHTPNEDKEKRNDAHCVSCGAKFIQGRIYFQSGKMLHAAKVSFREVGAAERLSAKIIRSRQPVVKKKTPATGNKKSTSSKCDSVSSSGSTNKGHGAKSPKRVQKGKVSDETQKRTGKSLSGSKSARSKDKVVKRKGMQKATQQELKLLKDSSRAKGALKSKSSSAKKGVSSGKTLGAGLIKEVSVTMSDQLPISPRAARWSGRNTALRNAESNAMKNSELLESASLPVVLCERSDDSVLKNIDEGEAPGMDVLEKDDLPCSSMKSEAESEMGLAVCSCAGELKEPLDVVCEEDTLQVTESKEDMDSEERDDGCESAPTSSDSSGNKNDVSISDDSSVDFQDDVICENLDAVASPADVGGTSHDEQAVSSKRKRESLSEDEAVALTVCELEDIPSDASAGTDKEEDVMEIDYNVDCSDDDMEVSSIVPSRDYSRDSNSSRDAHEESISISWTREEDKVILQTFQTELISENVFQKICELLPHRTLEEVQSRFETLMSFLKELTGD